MSRRSHTIGPCGLRPTGSIGSRSSTSPRSWRRSREHAALDGEPLVDLGRGNPEVGPPQHVIDALAEAANEPSAHGYPPFRGLPALREAIAARYSEVYGVELDPDTEVTIMPGTKTAICELALVTR